MAESLGLFGKFLALFAGHQALEKVLENIGAPFFSKMTEGGQKLVAKAFGFGIIDEVLTGEAFA